MNESIRAVDERLALRERELQTLFDIEKLVGEGPCADPQLDRAINILLIKTTGLIRYRMRLFNRGDEYSRIH